MNCFHCYEEVKYEVNILKNRLKILEQYEKNILDEKKKIEATIYLQTKLLNQIDSNLKLYGGIESKLFKEIMVNGLSVTKAIEKVAHEEEKDESTLWKYYYPKVKEKIANLKAMKD